MNDCAKDDNKKDWDTILGFSSMHREIDYYPSRGKKVNSSICRQKQQSTG
jgi:hypothetical protein